MEKRKGARKREEIPADILDQLNQGLIETANLVEWLAVDQRKLLQFFLHQHSREKYIESILDRIDGLKKQTVNTINEAIGKGLLAASKAFQDKELIAILEKHPSDIVRGWATYLIGNNKALNIKELLQEIYPYAADQHFGVRELAWLASRPRMASELEESIKQLEEWALSEDENIRRFASEALRPRGVWCAHIAELKSHPELAIGILNPLKSDPSKYVRDSVGNWLNDASKTRPDFVEKVCEAWEFESPTKETAYIVKRAMRTIRKK